MRKLPLLLVVVGALLIGGTWVLLHKPDDGGLAEFFSSEPKYEGHTLSCWMDHWSRMYGGLVVENVGPRLALKEMGIKAVPYLVAWISKPPVYHPGVNYPERALKGFEVLGPVAKSAVPDLVRMIGQNQGYPERALLYIGKDAVPPLADRLVTTLSDTNNPFFFGVMRSEIRKSSGFYIRGCILDVLNKMGTNAEAALPALIRTARTSFPTNNWALHQQNPCAVLANVGRNQPDRVIAVLLERFTNSPWSAGERGRIASAMSAFGTNRADVFLPVLVASLPNKETDDASRAQIGGALILIGHNQPEVLLPVFLAAVADKNTGEGIRCHMSGYLAEVGHNHPEIVIPALLTEYTNCSLYGRSSIAGALASFGGQARSVVPLLVADSQRQADQNYDTRWRIDLATAAKRIAPETRDALVPLLRDLESREPGIRQQTIYALGGLGTNAIEAIPALMKSLFHRDPQTRIDATQCLGSMEVNSEEFITLLGENLSHTNSFVSHGALSTLVSLSARSKVAFVRILKDAFSGLVDRDIREQAKYGLIDVARADPTFLVECLEDSDSRVRAGALKVFYDLPRRVPEAIPQLQRLTTSDPDDRVRSLAADVLQMEQRWRSIASGVPR